MISVVTGTLNRYDYLYDLLKNTIWSDDRIELVLVDGGSTDGTVELMKKIASKEPRLKFIEVGQRSSYPHYMNLGIKNASHELICQWNDDVILCNKWQDVIDEIDEHDVYIFNWKTGTKLDARDENWLKCNGIRDNGWIVINNAQYKYPQSIGEQYNEICVNYGIYKKNVFRKYGLYNPKYKYYCADGEMAMRAKYHGAKFKTCFNIKVCVLPAEKRAIMINEDVQRYNLDCFHFNYNTPSYFEGEFLGKSQ